MLKEILTNYCFLSPYKGRRIHWDNRSFRWVAGKARINSTSARAIMPLLVSVLLLMTSWSSAAYAELYRFLNADGRTEISHSVPTDRVKYGYEILDPVSGRVTRSVAPELTPAQAARKAEFEVAYNQCVRLQNRVRTLYQSVEDIDFAEMKALEAIENGITNTQANLVQLRIQRSQLEERAAQLERSGYGIDATVVANVERAKIQIESLEQQIADRRAEQDETRLQYELDRETFGQSDCVLSAVR